MGQQEKIIKDCVNRLVKNTDLLKVTSGVVLAKISWALISVPSLRTTPFALPELSVVIRSTFVQAEIGFWLVRFYYKQD